MQGANKAAKTTRGKIILQFKPEIQVMYIYILFSWWLFVSFQKIGDFLTFNWYMAKTMGRNLWPTDFQYGDLIGLKPHLPVFAGSSWAKIRHRAPMHSQKRCHSQDDIIGLSFLAEATITFRSIWSLDVLSIWMGYRCVFDSIWLSRRAAQT